MSEARWYTLAAVLPVVITSGLEHYRWAVERRDKRRKKAFHRRLTKALDEARAKDRAKRETEDA